MFDNNYLFALDGLVRDLLLLVGDQRSFVFGFRTQTLNGRHNVGLLREKCVTHVGRPLDIIRQPFNDVGKPSHRLNARVPRLLRHFFGKHFLVLYFLILLKPLMKLHEFKRICRRDQHLAK